MRKNLIPVFVAVLAMAGCAAGGAENTASNAAATPSENATETATVAVGSTKLHEMRKNHPRVVLAHEGGLTTLDATDGKVLDQSDYEGFLRLNPAGDGRHVMVSAGDEFLVYDAAVEARHHEDHYHYYAGTPSLTDRAFPAPHAGHVVVHAGKTVLFGDGDGSIQIFDTKQIGAAQNPVTSLKTDHPHHGVAVALADGSIFMTQGTEDERHTIQVVKDGQVLAQTEDCPGSHGEAAAQPTAGGDVVAMGCTNGPVVYRDGAFHKVPVADNYSRSGNLAGSAESPIILGDYKVDPEAAPERPTRVALIDTRSAQLSLVELGSSYWFRSLGRGSQGEGLVLTYDGNLQVIDVNTGQVTAKIAAISPWEEKEDWQEPGPILRVAGTTAYVTDAQKRELVLIDLRKNKVMERYQLDFEPVEMAIADGRATE